MKKNVGSVDRLVRIVVAVVFGILVFAKVFTGMLAIIFGIVAVILAFTGLIGWCGLYTLVGINTSKCCGSASEGEDKKGCCCGHK